jgi:hypothetical protein
MRAARTIGAWRAGEVEWLASRAASRSTILAGTWAGHCAAAWLVLAATGVIAEVRAGASAPSLELSGRIGSERSSWVEGRRSLVWRAMDPGRAAAEGSRARFELALGSSSGAGSGVILSARRIGSGAVAPIETRVEKRIGTRGDIEIEIPRGTGDVEFSLACGSGEDRVFLLSERGELWTPVASGRWASGVILERAALALAAWLALAIGLGGWMSASSAAALILVIWLPAWMSSEPSAIWPGGDLFAALAIAGRGRVPPPIDARSLACAALAIAAGFGLARWSIARWRREP